MKLLRMARNAFENIIDKAVEDAFENIVDEAVEDGHSLVGDMWKCVRKYR